MPSRTLAYAILSCQIHLRTAGWRIRSAHSAARTATPLIARRQRMTPQRSSSATNPHRRLLDSQWKGDTAGTSADLNYPFTGRWLAQNSPAILVPPPERFPGFGRPILAPAHTTALPVHDGETDHRAPRPPLSSVRPHAAPSRLRRMGGAHRSPRTETSWHLRARKRGGNLDESARPANVRTTRARPPSRSASGRVRPIGAPRRSSDRPGARSSSPAR